MVIKLDGKTALDIHNKTGGKGLDGLDTSWQSTPEVEDAVSRILEDVDVEAFLSYGMIHYFSHSIFYGSAFWSDILQDCGAESVRYQGLEYYDVDSHVSMLTFDGKTLCDSPDYVSEEAVKDILNVPMVYQYTAKFPTKDTPQSVLDNLNISEVVNPDDDTFTYTSTISMDLWNDTFELPQDDTYMMPIEHISRILGWEFWTGDNVLKIVSDELDDTNPDNFVIDTTVREETCYDVGTGEEIACD